MGKQPNIFLCYATKDRKKVEVIYDRLSEKGFIPWMDSRNLKEGEIWENKIEKNIKKSDIMLLFLSKNSINKEGFLQSKLKTALSIYSEKSSYEIYLIPVRLDDTPVPKSLSHIISADLFQDNGWGKFLTALKYQTDKVRAVNNVSMTCIECPDKMTNKLLYRIPQTGLENIKIGSEILVHDKQVALLYRDGIFFDMFSAGKHKINAENVPLLHAALKIENKKTFQAAIYFVSVREFTLPWGTPQPILAGNSLSNMTLLQGFGDFSFFVNSPKEFVEYVGGISVYSLDEIQRNFLNRILNMMTKTISDLSNKDDLSALEILSRLKSIEKKVHTKIQKDTKEIGIAFKRFQVASIKPSANSREELIQSFKFDNETEAKLNSKPEKVVIEKGEVLMGDKYITGQAGSVGPQSHTHDMAFNQSLGQDSNNLDTEKLLEELATLRKALREKATIPEHDIAIGEIASAEMAIKQGEPNGLIKHLSNAGKWAFDVATDIGTTIAAEVIKKSMGL